MGSRLSLGLKPPLGAQHSSPHEVCNSIIEDHQLEEKKQVRQAMVDCEAMYNL